MSFNPSIKNHLSGFDGLTQKSGVSGTHNLDAFSQAAFSNGVKILSKRGRIYFLLRGWRRLITIFLGFFKGYDCLAACVALLFNILVLFLCVRRFVLTKPFG